MRITWDTIRRFVLECEFAEADTARHAGLVWDKTTRSWWTHDPILVENLRGTPGLTITRDAQFFLASWQTKSKQSIEESRALSADFHVPVPDGIDRLTGKRFEYLPFQLAGIRYAMKRQDTLLGDQMGVGKTIQAIGTVNADSLSHRVLIVCPAFLKDNWLKEFTKWDVKHLTIGVIRMGREIRKTKTVEGVKTNYHEEVPWPSTDVIIVSYELLESWRYHVRSVSWDVLIVDEAHYLKNNKADRTKEVYGCRARFDEDQEAIEVIKARRRLFLSGTPFLNIPRELWSLIHSVDPNGLGRDRIYFERRYCDGKKIPIVPKPRVLFAGVAPPEITDTSECRMVWSAKGATNSEELQARLRATFMVRRLREDVLPMLPKKRRQVILVEADGVTKLLERERKTYEEYGVDLMDLDLDSPEFSKISAIRKEIGIKKIPFIVDRAKEALNETSKLVLFVHHHEVVDGIRAAFGRECVVVDGRVENDDRQALVDRFQEDPNCRIFLGTIGAAGVGFTLTAAWLAIFGELDWKPSTISQAEDRLCRIGQTKGALIQHIVLKDSLDERQVQLIIGKQEIADKSLDHITEAA